MLTMQQRLQLRARQLWCVPPRRGPTALIPRAMVQRSPGRSRVLRTDRLPPPPAHNLRGRARIRQAVRLAPLSRQGRRLRAGPPRALGLRALPGHHAALRGRGSRGVVGLAQLERHVRADPPGRAAFGPRRRRRSGRPARLGRAVGAVPRHRRVGAGGRRGRDSAPRRGGVEDGERGALGRGQGRVESAVGREQEVYYPGQFCEGEGGLCCR